MTFAPPARRPAPGERPVDPSVGPAPEQRIAWPLATALAIAAYALLTSGLTATGVLRDGDGPGLVRDLAIAGLIAATALLATRPRRRPADHLDTTAVALTVSGGAWTLLALVDMHLLGAIETGRPTLLADLLVHGTGLTLLLPGLALLRAPRLPRLPRHEGAHP